MTAPRVEIRLKTRDLDTDSKHHRVRAVPVPFDAGAELQLMRDFVAENHPDAELRSFTGHTASFVDSRYLIVVSFDGAELCAGRQQDEATAQSRQRVLF